MHYKKTLPAFYVIVFMLQLICFSCKKNEKVVIQPKAKFFVGGAMGGYTITQVGNNYTIGTNDVLELTNTSENAESVSWDFGNGKKTNEANPGLSYDSTGSYIVTLTANGKDGLKSKTSMVVTVKERYIKSVNINKIDINKFLPGGTTLPLFKKLDLWVELKYSQSRSDILTNEGDISAPTIYKSPVFENVDSSFHGDLHYELPLGQAIIPYPLNDMNVYVKGYGMVMLLYGNDGNNTYLLQSSIFPVSRLRVITGPEFNKSPYYAVQMLVPGSETNIFLDCEFR